MACHGMHIAFLGELCVLQTSHSHPRICFSSSEHPVVKMDWDRVQGVLTVHSLQAAIKAVQGHSATFPKNGGTLVALGMDVGAQSPHLLTAASSTALLFSSRLI